uniref:Secretion protein HlyD n=1 Tax=Chlorobium chlorochromatii (strain CaD3) TaxID=340177 RepID=Q3AS89_CHLCH
MKAIEKKTVRLLAVIVPLFLLFAFVAFRSGPLAPVPVTVTRVQQQALTPALSGIGTVEARYAYRIGPVASGRVLRLLVDVGDTVRAGQVVGEIDPVDLEERLLARRAAVLRAEAVVRSAAAKLHDAEARQRFAVGQEQRYTELLAVRAASSEQVEAKRQEAEVARATALSSQAALVAAREELAAAKADYQGLEEQRRNLLLIAPADGLVTNRLVEAGSTVVAGQSVLEIINPQSVWVAARFDQLQSAGLRAGLPATVRLRSQAGAPLAASVERIEPLADRITEELLAKVVFNVLPNPLPPIGELCEVSVGLPSLPRTPVVPNASVHRSESHGGKLGVWVVEGSSLRFVEVRIGATDQMGNVQILSGLKGGEQVVVYSKSALNEGKRITIVKPTSKQGAQGVQGGLQ